MPILLKGIQTHEDAYLASVHAPHIKGILLSNHGGRAADTAPPAIHTLLEIRKYCPEVLQKVEVLVDGGIRRGTDVVKALCLGASGVCAFAGKVSLLWSLLRIARHALGAKGFLKSLGLVLLLVFCLEKGMLTPNSFQVGIGRAVLFGLGAGGVAGVERTLESKTLKNECF